MIRRHALAVFAVVATGFLVAAPAEAGGTSGAVGVKKTATVKIKNNTEEEYYVLVVPESLDGSKKFGKVGTVGWAKNLGAALVSPGATLDYPVPAGPGGIFILLPEDVTGGDKADLPPPEAEGEYKVSKGKVVTKRIGDGPVIK